METLAAYGPAITAFSGLLGIGKSIGLFGQPEQPQQAAAAPAAPPTVLAPTPLPAAPKTPDVMRMAQAGLLEEQRRGGGGRAMSLLSERSGSEKLGA